MGDDESPRRRRVLRASAAAGLAALGWPLASVSARDRTGVQDDSSPFAFSYGLQSDSRFEVLTGLQTAEGDPVTEEIPADCFDDDDQSREFQVVIVRAFADDLRLGYTGVFVPADAVAMQVTTTATPGEETTTPENETTLAEETTTTTLAEETTTTTLAEETTPGDNATTGAAMQDETTTPGDETTTGTETVTTPATGNRTTTPAVGDETTATETPGLPQIRVGEWYRVTDLTTCGDLNRVSLESAEPRTTWPEA